MALVQDSKRVNLLLIQLHCQLADLTHQGKIAGCCVPDRDQSKIDGVAITDCGGDADQIRCAALRSKDAVGRLFQDRKVVIRAAQGGAPQDSWPS